MTDIINGEIYKYFGTEEALSEASHITNLKTGERVELTNDAKLLYSRMRKRYQFFTTSSTGGNKGIYHDNVEELAASANISKSTALRCLKVLKQVGLVVATLSGRSNQWTVVNITPDSFLLERNAGTPKNPVWVDCLKHPVFGSAKEDVAPEKVKPTPKPTKKPAARKAPTKQQTVSPFDFKKPRDESRDWWYLERYNDADQFTGFNDFDLPYLAMFESQGKLINQHSILHLKTKREAYARQQQT
ncbi:winged helix-turn-helix domain-containing protein [Escherichia albertii]|uniref:winged helix-turn-helix domain-containing protein n=1 Tax=Escherichia albertii TaxID=208962 RepID=UPI001331499E|nr:winged helix-turn-helix domain-containing protein [Escherichia albertii]MCB2257966.1 winged helix-turn-helix domain-containing protein [Escherichia albertii]MCB2265054.1 winged helix-turn-helix domain-containing protein [Escherichia albertii]MCB2270059.1 winged helix-turn-helix domain-containing protein [Escherichia albertii]MDD9751123.1 winged helix-turn-helix domain-containing protein [Escherichia albertii]QST29923.1 winged helix-turn-helix transcriptional regulator [Escherichia albertii]